MRIDELTMLPPVGPQHQGLRRARRVAITLYSLRRPLRNDTINAVRPACQEFTSLSTESRPKPRTSPACTCSRCCARSAASSARRTDARPREPAVAVSSTSTAGRRCRACGSRNRWRGTTSSRSRACRRRRAASSAKRLSSKAACSAVSVFQGLSCGRPRSSSMARAAIAARSPRPSTAICAAAPATDASSMRFRRRERRSVAAAACRTGRAATTSSARSSA